MNCGERKMHERVGQRGGRGGVRHRVRLAVERLEHRRRPGTDGDQQADAGGRRVGPDLAMVLALAGSELEHVAEHRDASSGGFLHGEVVQGGAHGQRVGVVAVIDDRCAAGEREPLAPQRAEAHVHAPRRTHPDGSRGRDRGERVEQVVA
jgi:hypothetical protein